MSVVGPVGRSLLDRGLRLGDLDTLAALMTPRLAGLVAKVKV
jgi:hypothetical protein